MVETIDAFEHCGRVARFGGCAPSEPTVEGHCRLHWAMLTKQWGRPMGLPHSGKIQWARPIGRHHWKNTVGLAHRAAYSQCHQRHRKTRTSERAGDRLSWAFDTQDSSGREFKGCRPRPSILPSPQVWAKNHKASGRLRQLLINNIVPVDTALTHIAVGTMQTANAVNN